MSVEITLQFRNSKWENLLEKTLQNQPNLEDKISEQVFTIAQKLKVDECEKSENNILKIIRGESVKDNDGNYEGYLTKHYPDGNLKLCRLQYFTYTMSIHCLEKENNNIKSLAFVEILKLEPQPHIIQINDK